MAHLSFKIQAQASQSCLGVPVRGLWTLPPPRTLSVVWYSTCFYEGQSLTHVLLLSPDWPLGVNSWRNLPQTSTGVCSVSCNNEAMEGPCPAECPKAPEQTRGELGGRTQAPPLSPRGTATPFQISTSIRKLQLKAASAVGSQGVCAHHYREAECGSRARDPGLSL